MEKSDNANNSKGTTGKVIKKSITGGLDFSKTGLHAPLKKKADQNQADPDHENFQDS